ncbi:G-type lectin S-receptor-like serine/threonine-protein kinase SD1-1 [Vitis vinifera]|uniref:G-type lectin S-receptor-like serine/threonine-protein kinase SD1-1 n=1 Tax=Vitis vinifera TaxID=29760 RepID=UPI002882E67E|nr:G-type lectin S-receptor-like serine/threonine-protein kinase SD1-1 [Vitis vinifera]
MGSVQRFVLGEGSNKWDVMYTVQNDQCDNYGHSGANGICRIDNRPICDCLDGFVPKSESEWEFFNWTSGCIRTPLDCQKGQGFIKLRGVKLSDLLKFWENTSMTGKECEVECLKSYSCMAYTNSNVSRGSGFLIWFGDLIDIREFVQDIEQLVYIRIPASELELMGDSSKKKYHFVILVVALMAFRVLVFGLTIWIIVWKKRRGKRGQQEQKEDQELPLFDLVTVASATNNFSDRNMIGKGGFGFVYKGILSMGQEIAVKRLLTDSRQGLQEFKNEVILIAELQHCNLLDIVMGVSRGLLYLHQDFRLWVIHRDLKTCNILLDGELSPKISVFSLTRIFGGHQTEAKTNGYMSPEYGIDGKFSAKSDVFGFGVLLLEIVSGKKNRGFSHPHHHHNLLGHAWMLWNEDKALELMDACLRDSCVESQVPRCIQVDLFCVQKLPANRPTISSVIFTLGHEEAVLPQPKQPGFFRERSSVDDEDAIQKMKLL